MGLQGPKDVIRDTARDLAGLVGELAILKADTHHWLTGAEYAVLRHRLEDAHAAAEAALVVQRSTHQRSLIGCLDCETREEAQARSLLSPSSGPTQAGTTPRLTFRAILAAENVELDMSLYASREVSGTWLVLHGVR